MWSGKKKKKIKDPSKICVLSCWVNSCVLTEMGNGGQRKQELCLEPVVFDKPRDVAKERYDSRVRGGSQGSRCKFEMPLP